VGAHLRGRLHELLREFREALNCVFLHAAKARALSGVVEDGKRIFSGGPVGGSESAQVFSNPAIC
jgi:hypothetical protein